MAWLQTATEQFALRETVPGDRLQGAEQETRRASSPRCVIHARCQPCASHSGFSSPKQGSSACRCSPGREAQAWSSTHTPRHTGTCPAPTAVPGLAQTGGCFLTTLGSAGGAINPPANLCPSCSDCQDAKGAIEMMTNTPPGPPRGKAILPAPDDAEKPLACPKPSAACEEPAASLASSRRTPSPPPRTPPAGTAAHPPSADCFQTLLRFPARTALVVLFAFFFFSPQARHKWPNAFEHPLPCEQVYLEGFSETGSR